MCFQFLTKTNIQLLQQIQHIYHPTSALYAEKSSLADINPQSYHVTAFELMNPLLYINFPSFERVIVSKDLKCTLPWSVTF